MIPCRDRLGAPLVPIQGLEAGDNVLVLFPGIGRAFPIRFGVLLGSLVGLGVGA